MAPVFPQETGGVSVEPQEGPRVTREQDGKRSQENSQAEAAHLLVLKFPLGVSRVGSDALGGGA